jgi:hypothetical protein
MTKRTMPAALLAMVALLAGACATPDPEPTPSASETSALPDVTESPDGPDVSPSPGDSLTLAEGTSEGVAWKLVLKPGTPVCVELQSAAGAAGTVVCDENSEQDFNGDERMRFAFGGVNPEQLPKFVVGITAPEVTRVIVNLPEGDPPGSDTKTSSAASNRRFFAVPLDPEPAQEVLAVRGLDAQGRTVAGFRIGPAGEVPSPLPTG